MLRSPTWLLPLAASAAACGSGTEAAPAVRAPGGGWIASRPADPGGGGAGGPVRSLDRFAARLSALAIAELSVSASDAEAPCRGVMPPFRIVSALSDSGEDVSCLVGAGGAACINFVDHDVELAEQALCGDSAEQVDVPRRVRDAAAAAEPGWRIGPIPAPEGIRALGLRAGKDHYLLVRRGAGWLASPLPVARSEGKEGGPERLLDSRALTDDASFVLVSSSYRGGVEQGELATRVLVLAADDLAERAARDIGLLVWTVDPEETEAPDGGSSPRARPHLEVLLEPSITGDGALRLELIREHRPEPDRRRFERAPCTAGGDGDLLGLACPVHRLDLIEKDSGFWRFKDGALTRDRH